MGGFDAEYENFALKDRALIGTLPPGLSDIRRIRCLADDTNRYDQM